MMDELTRMEKESRYHRPQCESELRSVMAENIPAPLTERAQWVCWRYEEVAGRSKPTKVPYDPVTGARIDVTQREALRPFEVVYQSYTHSGGCDGIGFSLMMDDGFVGVDIDNCVDAAGELSPLASDVIELLDSYSEISPSGRGVRIFTRADLGEFTGRRTGAIELYNGHRYLTVTGQRILSAPATLAPRLEELRALYRRYLMPTRRTLHNPDRILPSPAEDAEVLGRLFNGRFGEVYEQIYHGDTSSVYGHADPGQPDESRADTLLCNGLAFYTGGDAAQMRRILLSSPRAQQRWAKWEKRVRGAQTYLDYQIAESIRYGRK